jgi:hypothetical protein
MSYSIYVESDHVYVKYADVVDTVDIVRLTKDNLFIGNIRVLENLVHDFSNCEEVSVTLEDMKDVALMANIESNFTENLVEVIIPRATGDQESQERIEALSQAIKSRDWTVLLAKDYAHALQQIRVTC